VAYAYDGSEDREHEMNKRILHLAAVALASSGEDGFDWKRDAVVLKNGKEERGVVIEACDPEQIVLLLDGGKREEFPLAEVDHVDKLRDRLVSFLSKHKAGLSVDAEWELLQGAKQGLPYMARVQAYHILLLEPEHAGAHEFLGHKRSGSGWNWDIDGKSVSEKKFHELIREWNSRLVLESEHFVLETDCGLKRGVQLLFDLEGLYLWWMSNLGPELRATEDVDDPRSEKITFLVHKDFESFQPLIGKEPYYDPSGEVTTSKGGINVARTFYKPEETRPVELFELAAQSLIYSTLVLGETKGEPGGAFKRNAHWVEVGLGYWVARHCGGPPGYPEFKQPLDGTFTLDFDTARWTLERVHGGPLTQARHELANLIGLLYENFVGTDLNIPLYKARSASFVSFLIEVNPSVMKGKKELGRGRDGLWYYFREVYGTPKGQSSSAFDDGFGGAKVESLEELWKAWTKPFTSVVGK
jgi:hypothetical protein